MGNNPQLGITMQQDRLQALTHWLQNRLQHPSIELTPVCGDASFRKYYRATLPNQQFIAVDAPPETQKNSEFIAIADALKQVGIAAPEVIAADLKQGFLCLTDLGDKLLLDQLNNDNIEYWYQQALALLPLLQNIAVHETKLPQFDRDFIALENRIFTQWLIEQHLGLQLSQSQQQVLTATFALLTENSLEQPQVAMHRDFHSRNIMVLDSGELATIDFQDMVAGPITYDAVSLLRDCYCRWPDSSINTLKQHYFQLLPQENISQEQFNRWFDLTGIQRHLKAAGIFARLWHRDNKPGYLADIPTTLNYVIDVAADYPELAEFTQLIKTILQQVLTLADTTAEQPTQ